MSLDHPPISEVFQGLAGPAPARVPKGKSPPPFSLRLTTEEKGELLRRAGNQPLGAYIRARLLGDATTVRRALRKPVQDEEALGRLLAELGKARLSSNLNQLAKAANTGTLPLTQETEVALNEACQEIRWMRDELVKALGLRSPS